VSRDIVKMLRTGRFKWAKADRRKSREPHQAEKRKLGPPTEKKGARVNSPLLVLLGDQNEEAKWRDFGTTTRRGWGIRRKRSVSDDSTTTTESLR